MIGSVAFPSHFYGIATLIEVTLTLISKCKHNSCKAELILPYSFSYYFSCDS
jgi:hypothetical protein